MKFGTSAAYFFVAAFGLTGCMGGGGGGVSGSSGATAGGDDTEVAVGAPNADPPQPGTNGLDYGSAGQSLSQTEGRAVSMRAVGFGDTDGLGLTNATITLATGFFDEGATTQDRDGVIEIFDETVAITNGAGNLTNGDEVRIAFEPDRAGAFAAIVDATVSDLSGINGEAIFVFGFETDPDDITALNNADVDYTGSFQASGAFGSAQDTQYEGTIVVTADFRNAGTAQIDMYGRFNNARDIDLESSFLQIGNGGCAGSVACERGCSGNSSLIDGTFYGPNAAEVGGVLAIDINVDGTTYDGVGSFIIGQD